MFVPDGGLGRRLDTMYEWHRTRGIESHHGRGRRTDEDRYYVRWCFADAALARAFADKFGIAYSATRGRAKAEFKTQWLSVADS
jgi:hypothetical protein